MTNNYINVTVTSKENKRVTVSTQEPGFEVTATTDTGKFWAQTAENWATSDTIVENKDYSSKYYANKAKVNAENASAYEKASKEIYNSLLTESDNLSDEIRITANEALENIQTTKINAVDDINSTKTNILKDIEFVADGEKEEIQELAEDAKADIKSTGFYMENDKLYFTNSKGEKEEFKSGGSSFNLFDTKISDHVLDGEEAIGWALQGTYVNGAVYPDFYNKCLEEYHNAIEEKWTQPILTGSSTQVAEGEIVCTASSYYTTENRQPYCAMDGVKGGAVATLGSFTLNNTKTGWWQVKFPYKLKITGLKYYAPYSTSGASYIATTGRFYTSSDKSTPIGDELSTTDNWQEVDIANIPPEGVITDTIYFDITNSGGYGGIGELEITATKAGVVKHPNGHLFYDIADKDQIDEFFNATGSAWMYGIDTENERIFLPRDKYFAVAGVASVVGNGMTLGLTDGTKYGGLQSYLAGTNTFTWATESKYGTSVGTASTNSAISGKTLGITTDPTKSGIEAHLTTNEDKYLYICVGNTEVKSTVTNVVDVTTTENDTLPLFTGQYFDFTPNHLSWLKGGRKARESEYPTCYNELVNELVSHKYGLKVINEVDMITGIDYSEYWKVNQDDMTFTAPTAISLKALDNIAPVVGNGMTLGLTNGTTNFGLSNAYDTSNPLGGWIGSYGANVGTERAGSSLNTNMTIGVTFDPTKSGIEAHLVENSNAQLYFKVANAVQNLELLNVGKVMENAVLRSSLIECHVVVETYKNGASWYRVWSDGWCEQGGNGTLVSGAYTVTFLKPFVDTNYTALSIAVGSGDNFYFNNPNNIIDKTVSSMKIRIYNNSSLPSDWQASGYIW